MMSIRMLYGQRFQCARMGGGYSPLMMYRDPIGSNNAYFRSHSALQFRGGGWSDPSKGYLSIEKKSFSSFLLISPHFSSFLLIPFIYLKISKEIDFCGALGQRKSLLNNILKFFVTVSKKELKKTPKYGYFLGKNCKFARRFSQTV